VVGRETGACDRVYVDREGKPFYSARLLEVIYDRDGREIQRRPPELVPPGVRRGGWKTCRDCGSVRAPRRWRR
jgi:hypothetical protein